MAEPKYLAQSVQMFGINTDLRTAYDTIQQAWRDSSCRKIFFNRLRLHTPLHKPLQISKAVCMALGTLNNRLSLQQGILFLDMVRFLEEQEGSPCKSIELFAQDPRFPDADKDFFIRALGIARMIEQEPTNLLRGTCTQLCLGDPFGKNDLSVASMRKRYHTQIQLPCIQFSNLRDNTQGRDGTEDEVTLYFFHLSSQPGQGKPRHSGVWSMDPTLDEQGRPRMVPWSNPNVKQYVYVS